MHICPLMVSSLSGMAHLALVGRGGGDQVANALQSVRPGDGRECLP